MGAGQKELCRVKKCEDQDPAWRPQFRTPWWASLLGAFGCFATMFMINPGATFIAAFVSLGVFYIMQRRQIS